MNDLEGILVVSVEHAVAAPMTSCKLADAGARVIKVERDGGDFARRYDDYVQGESAYFVWLNRGKESVCLDLKAPQDKQILINMLKKADVFIQNLGPGVMDRLGFSVEVLGKLNPKLVTCTITGYSSNGPQKEKKAYDLLVQAESGLVSITGNSHGFSRVGISICDIATGVTAYYLILQALIARATTGKGRHIEVPLYGVISDWMNVPFLQFHYGQKKPAPCGVEHPTIAPYGAFTCKDGKDVLVSVQNESEWKIFCEQVLQRPELASHVSFATNTERVKNRAQLDQICAERASKMLRDEMIALLESANIGCGRISGLEDIESHPDTQFVEINTPGGTIRMLAPIAAQFGIPQTPGDVPALDAHGKSIRAEFGGSTG